MPIPGVTRSLSEAAAAGILGALDQQTLTRLAKEGTFVAVGPGQSLFQQGTAPRYVYLLCEGRLRLWRSDSEGRQLLLEVVKPGAVLDLVSTVTGTGCVWTGEMETVGRAFRMDLGTFRELLRQNPGLRQRVLASLAADVQVAWQRTFGSATQRGMELVARELIRAFGLRAPWRQPGEPLVRDVVRYKLALRLGFAQESVCRFIVRLVRERIVARHGRSGLRLLNARALARAAHELV